MSEAVPTWIVGAGGMLAGELARLLEGHWGLRLEGVVSRNPGVPLRELHGHLASDLATEDAESAAARMAAALADGDGRLALFLALPHGHAWAAWAELRAELGTAAERVLVVDLSADYRLESAARHRAAYGAEAPDAGERASFCYGLPELWPGRIREARRAAAAGCFATALQLAAVPAAASGLLDPSAPWVFHGITGSSGSGVTPRPTTHHPHRHGNLHAYSVGGHRHEAELAGALEELSLAPPLCFVPHSGPFARGIHLTAVLPLAGGASLADARGAYAERFAPSPFVELLAEGVPEVRKVVGSNRADLSLAVRGESLLVFVALDNLIKGGAGQGLQCMNLMAGLEEHAGLPRSGTGVA
ncbi:MAG: N-acetyl-gamma-glutamyl-phosphate reductase [Planctomycetes bacterium]|nr:N-acetyl-gamma-glutamyl-phosphate reductase [Planctomycetota bacterium]MDP6410814.1 N-acetyl-gamma-glutamyl-phosphate reductase [Planctomycetota bacterium]